jgi:hypothetical protein
MVVVTVVDWSKGLSCHRQRRKVYDLLYWNFSLKLCNPPNADASFDRD